MLNRLAAPIVLCVDDEPAVLDGLRRQARGRHDVRTATSGEAGLAMLDAEPNVAVIVSDMRMPGMDGARFLSECRRRRPAVPRMLLTGFADLDAAITAVNEAQLFRFLSKPCAPELLAEAIDAGVATYRMAQAERELLEKTLRSSVDALVETLSLANPTAFARARRIADLVEHMSPVVPEDHRWEVQVAALLSQLGTVALPDQVAEKMNRALPLDADEARMVANLPESASQLLAGIPRLERVREIIVAAAQARHSDGDAGPEDEHGDAAVVHLGANVLRLACDFDHLTASGKPGLEALAVLKEKSPWIYPVEPLELLATVIDTFQPEVIQVPLAKLRAGMVFARDVHLPNGLLLVGGGAKVSEALLLRMRNHAAKMGIDEALWIVNDDFTKHALFG